MSSRIDCYIFNETSQFFGLSEIQLMVAKTIDRLGLDVAMGVREIDNGREWILEPTKEEYIIGTIRIAVKQNPFPDSKISVTCDVVQNYDVVQEHNTFTFRERARKEEGRFWKLFDRVILSEVRRRGKKEF